MDWRKPAVKPVQTVLLWITQVKVTSGNSERRNGKKRYKLHVVLDASPAYFYHIPFVLRTSDGLAILPSIILHYCQTLQIRVPPIFIVLRYILCLSLHREF